MDEDLVKKLGEALALCYLLEEALEKGSEALNIIFGEQEVNTIFNENLKQVNGIKTLALNFEYSDSVDKAAEEKLDLVKSFRERLLKSGWKDLVPVTQWLGFLEGSSLVQWSLIESRANKSHILELVTLAQVGVSFHQVLLGKIVSSVRK